MGGVGDPPRPPLGYGNPPSPSREPESPLPPPPELPRHRPRKGPAPPSNSRHPESLRAPLTEPGVPQAPPEPAARPARRRRRRHHRRGSAPPGTKAPGPRGGRDAEAVTHGAGETIAGRAEGGWAEPMRREGRGCACAERPRPVQTARGRERREKAERMDPGGFPPVEEVEELSQELLRELSSGCTEELLRRGLHRRERLHRRLREAQGKARELAQGLAEAEAGLCHRLRGAQAHVQRLRGRRQELDTELERAQGSLSGARDKTQALRRALEELQEQLQQLEQHQEEEEEEHSLPPDVYVAQLYYEISRIDWDCSAQPGHIRGVHYGPDIAVPLDLDGAQHSGTFVSDFLWGLVPTEWRPRRAPVLPREPLAP
ncbi:kinetochore protein Spc24 [Agelaius tricolor]|uniref:kinetochore protein Spc24 n=1 Tax=Agelaius tricolor TaxID=9191 RepID=UPI0039F2619E